MTEEEYNALINEYKGSQKNGDSQNIAQPVQQKSAPQQTQENGFLANTKNLYKNLLERTAYGARFGEAKLNYLKQKYGESNVQVGSDNEPLVRRNGEWVRFNPKGLDWGDVYEALPDVALGLGLGALTGGGSVAAQGGARLAQILPKTVLDYAKTPIGKTALVAAGESIAKQAVTSPILGAIFGGQEEGFTSNRVVDPLLNAGLGAGMVGAAAGLKSLASTPTIVKNAPRDLVRVVGKFVTRGGDSDAGKAALEIAKKRGLPLPTAAQTAKNPGALNFSDALESSIMGKAAFENHRNKVGSAIQNLSDIYIPQGSSIREAGKAVYNSFDETFKATNKAVREINAERALDLETFPGVDENVIDASSIKGFVERMIGKMASGQTGKAYDNIAKRVVNSLNVPESVMKDGVISPMQATMVMKKINDVLNPESYATLTESQKQSIATAPKAAFNEFKTLLFDATKKAGKENPSAQKAFDLMKGYQDTYKPLNALKQNIINTVSKEGKKTENIVKLVFGAGKNGLNKDRRDISRDVGDVVNFLLEKNDIEPLEKFQKASAQHIFDAVSPEKDINLNKLNLIIKRFAPELNALYKNKPESIAALNDLRAYLEIATKKSNVGNSATAPRTEVHSMLRDVVGGIKKGFNVATSNYIERTLSDVLANRDLSLKFSEVLRQSMQFSPKTPQRISVGGRALGKLGLEYLGDENQ